MCFIQKNAKLLHYFKYYFLKIGKIVNICVAFSDDKLTVAITKSPHAWNVLWVVANCSKTLPGQVRLLKSFDIELDEVRTKLWTLVDVFRRRQRV